MLAEVQILKQALRHLFARRVFPRLLAPKSTKSMRQPLALNTDHKRCHPLQQHPMNRALEHSFP
jgi:hypothetical protein